MSPTSDQRLEQVTVRRSPKYAVFLLLGGAVGMIVAMILTFAFDGTTQVSPNTGLVYSQMQVFGFLLLIFVSAGVALGGAVALILDRVYARRARTLRVDHERIITSD
ncbi:potassium transporter Trk [Microbacterium sp. bgisy207]|jgi:ABC-type multidrug transport system fused ATPase/permease subunit|uniref:potassium transporter Trk n=1 Tax=Microbacterium sp. bgisy207 TaxID=3413800 RepID=UPI003EBFD373